MNRTDDDLQEVRTKFYTLHWFDSSLENRNILQVQAGSQGVLTLNHELKTSVKSVINGPQSDRLIRAANSFKRHD